MDNLPSFSEIISEHVKARNKAIENQIRVIMQRFGLFDDESIIQFATKNICSMAHLEGCGFVGVIVNNRWLYTTSGQIIGKKGNRWMIEKIEL